MGSSFSKRYILIDAGNALVILRVIRKVSDALCLEINELLLFCRHITLS